MKKKPVQTITTNQRLFGLMALILGFSSSIYALQIFIPLGITLFALFAAAAALLFTQKR